VGSRLLIFGRFADDSQRILAGICKPALVGIEGCLNLARLAFELGVAPFADAEGRFHDSQLALLHDCSLAHLDREATAL